MASRFPAIDAGRGGSADPLAVITASLFPAAAAICGLLAAACGTVLAVRRLTAATGSPGAATVVATAAAGLLLMTLGDRAVAGDRARRRDPAGGAHWTAVLTRLGLMTALAAVAFPLRNRPPVDAMATVATVVLAAMASSRGIGLPLDWPSWGGRGFGRLQASTSVGRAASAVVGTTIRPLPAPVGGSLLQRSERLLLSDGMECVRGSVLVVVPRGARSGSGHLGFCPPFPRQPTVDVGTDYDAIEAVVSAAEVLPWGVRVECRLDEPAEETIEIPVMITAHSVA